MEPQEKKLIENLFNRLFDSEKNDFNRDIPADNLIKNLLSKQPHASYYMAQTILVQETAINKLNEKINELEKKIDLMNKLENKKNNSSFLSSLFGSNSSEKISKKIDDNRFTSPGLKDSNNQSIPNNLRTTSYNSPNASNNGQSSNNGSSFFSGALQTATGVAGGMVMANILTHLFDQKNLSEEVFNHVHNSHLDPDIIVEREIHDHYIHEDGHKDNISNNTHHNHDDSIDPQQDNDDNNIDINDDDNFI